MEIKGYEYEEFQSSDEIESFILEIDSEVRGLDEREGTLKESYEAKSAECSELLESINEKLTENKAEFKKTNAWGNLSDLEEV